MFAPHAIFIFSMQTSDLEMVVHLQSHRALSCVGSSSSAKPTASLASGQALGFLRHFDIYLPSLMFSPCHITTTLTLTLLQHSQQSRVSCEYSKLYTFHTFTPLQCLFWRVLKQAPIPLSLAGHKGSHCADYVPSLLFPKLDWRGGITHAQADSVISRLHVCALFERPGGSTSSLLTSLLAQSIICRKHR